MIVWLYSQPSHFSRYSGRSGICQDNYNLQDMRNDNRKSKRAASTAARFDFRKTNLTLYFYSWFISLRSFARYWDAASLPPRPNARPPAMASIATNPVNNVWAKTPAIPSWYKAARIAKIQIAHFVMPPRRFGEGTSAAFAEPTTTRLITSAIKAATTKIRRSEEHTSELQSHSFISYAVFCLKKKN